MTGKTWTVDLTATELLALDGACSAKAQAAVDQAKHTLSLASSGLTEKQAAVVAAAVADAIANGVLCHQPARLRHCSTCGTSPGYAKYKSGNRRGQNNLDKPLLLHGIELAVRFVRVQNYVSIGACNDCMAIIRPVLVDALADVRAQVPAVLAAPGRPAWVKHNKVQCTACGWEGHQGQMRKRRTLMGDGFYPGGCPNCPAENLPLGVRLVKPVDGFVVTADTDVKAVTA